MELDRAFELALCSAPVELEVRVEEAERVVGLGGRIVESERAKRGVTGLRMASDAGSTRKMGASE